jgi:hypothetical protein
MKKYVKPELFYEHYELNQHIADCAWELVNSNKETCSAVADSVQLPGFPNLFMASGNGCVLIPGDNYSDFCYHDGAQGVNVFAS